MTAILATLALLAVVVAGVVVLAVLDARLRREPWNVVSAEDRLTAEYRQTRRQMNDAAGQSWRNLAE